MCGILGFNWTDSSLLKKSLKEINHRGPDDSGTFIDRSISLGHKRLSIIDLSKSGKQPLSNENNSVWVVFNGEIYNFKEIKEQLRKHNFKSNTDTEILVHLYEEQGIKMLDKLQGMFAFCIYDTRRKILFLARDRIGIKPLYYWNHKGKFAFSSEIKAILQNKEIKKEINPNALSSFLVFRANTQTETIFKNIKKLPPGHFLVYNLKTKRYKITKYWHLTFTPQPNNISFFIKKLQILLEDSVKARLMSDVPYGAYLSGGVDSGTIVSLMSRFSDRVKTFSVGFPDDSETNEARFLANKFNTDHHELIIEESSVKHLPDIIYQADEPMSDPTSIPIYLLSKYTKKYCTVILTGEGADEVFAGYPQYKFMKLHHHLIKHFPKIMTNKFPLLVKKTPKQILNRGFKFASALGERGIERFSNFINANNHSGQYLNQISIFNEEEQSELLSRKVELYKQYSSYFQNSRIVTNSQKLDFTEPMVDDLLMKIDKNTMASSIEGRVPFLDHRIVELSARIPDNLKLRGFTKDKFILREASRGLIPNQTRKRKKKHFFVPIDNWFKKELAFLKNELLSEKYIKKQDIFNYNYIKKINKEFESSKLFYSRQLWTLIVFQLWYKRYIENEKIKI